MAIRRKWRFQANFRAARHFERPVQYGSTAALLALVLGPACFVSGQYDCKAHGAYEHGTQSCNAACALDAIAPASMSSFRNLRY